MKMMFAAALLLVGATAAGAAGPTASFRFGGVEFEAPIPDGYCLPQGADIDAAQLLAAADRENVTHLTLYRCGANEGARNDYILVKTPRQALFASLEREQLLAGMAQAFESAEFESTLAAVPDRVAGDVSSVVGREVDLTGRIQPLGRDDTCAYMGGTLRVTSAELSYPISVGICMTVVSGRLVGVNYYGPDRGSAGVRDLLERAKLFVQSMSGRPAS